MIRSKGCWYIKGEKNTKYFLNLEKKEFNTKTIKHLQLENNNVMKTNEEILTEAKSFYQNLYASRSPDISVHDVFFFPEECIATVKLDQHVQEECEGPLTKEECLNRFMNHGIRQNLGLIAFRPNFIKHSGQTPKVIYLTH